MSKVLEHHIQSVSALISDIFSVIDPYTAGHQKRVGDISLLMGKRMGLDAEQLHNLYIGACIHDIGKAGIPLGLLSKPTKLGKEEFELIKTHPIVGYNMLEHSAFHPTVMRIVKEHHEKCDGSGYPEGLKAEDICIESRIVAVADTFEAVISHRPYRPALPLEQAIDILFNGRNGHYCKEVITALLECHSEGELTSFLPNKFQPKTFN